MDYSELANGHLEVVVDNKIATVTLNRPDRLNAFGDGLHEALEEFLHMVNDDSEVNVAVLTGAGRAFSAGGDVKAMADRAGGETAQRHPMELLRGPKTLIQRLLMREKWPTGRPWPSATPRLPSISTSGTA